MNRAKLRIIALATFILYSAVLCYFLFFANYYGRNFEGFHSGYFEALKEYAAANINLIPFSTVFLYIRGYYLDAISVYPLIVNIIGNFFAFMPIGFYLPYFFKRLSRPLYFFSVVLLLIAAVEVLQLIIMTGVCDVDDLILNVSGAMLVYSFARKILFK